MLKDKVKILIVSGLGGMGSSSVKNIRYVGGDGGAGGNIIFQGEENSYDLSFFATDMKYQAENGYIGKGRNHQGRDGNDLILKVPLATEIIRDDGEKFIISEHKQQVIVAQGGRGGLGNVTLNRQPTEEDSWDRIKNEEFEVQLIYKIKSDVIFLGYPNAGKSSLLNELCGAKYKVASYAFTTLEPQLGMMEGKLLMDLPGLIEGTSEGKGLGTRFLQHTEFTLLVASFISLEDEEPYKTYISLREEIKNISPKLAEIPEIIILTKTDEADSKKTQAVIKEFEKNGKSKKDMAACSVLDEKSIEKVRELIREKLK
jgi:GTPase